jgi:predicted ArsR family transcriptional regulator
MINKTRAPKILTIRTKEQKKAIASPLRMELLGLFTDRNPLSVAQMADRVGRPATALHYHVGMLEKTGLLRRTGHNRSGRRPEALYLPAADLFKLEQRRGDPSDAESALKTLSTAFRMAERDMKAALTHPATRSTGPHRNAYGARMHCRLSKKDLAELNRHLRAIEKMLSRSHKTHEPSPNDAFVSLTVALMPLRNREVKP